MKTSLCMAYTIKGTEPETFEAYVVLEYTGGTDEIKLNFLSNNGFEFGIMESASKAENEPEAFIQALENMVLNNVEQFRTEKENK